MKILLKYQPRKWHSKPIHKSFVQQATGISFFQWKPLTCPWSIISLVSCPYLTPLLFHSPWLTLGIMLLQEYNHLSAHLLQKPERRYRPPMQKDTSLSRSNGVLCSWWRRMPFLGALLHCMNHCDFKSYRGVGHSHLSLMRENVHIVDPCVQGDRISTDIILR